MAILMRGGAYADFDPSKLKPREWAVVLENDPSAKDGKAIYICFAAGNVKRISTYEDMVDDLLTATDDIKQQYITAFNEIKTEIEGIRDETETFKNTAVTKANESELSSQSASASAGVATQKAGEASQSADDAEEYSNYSKSYAIGTDGEVREGDETDNSKYYYEQSKNIYDNFSQAGTVTGVKGESETAYRTGNVNLTKENIGLGDVENFKAVSTVASQELTEEEKANARANIGAASDDSESDEKISRVYEYETIYVSSVIVLLHFYNSNNDLLGNSYAQASISYTCLSDGRVKLALSLVNMPISHNLSTIPERIEIQIPHTGDSRLTGDYERFKERVVERYGNGGIISCVLTLPPRVVNHNNTKWEYVNSPELIAYMSQGILMFDNISISSVSSLSTKLGISANNIVGFAARCITM